MHLVFSLCSGANSLHEIAAANSTASMAVKVAFDGRSRVYRLLRAWKYDLFASVFFVLFRLFYRQVEIWGEDDSSQEDALIFVAGPHSNDVECLHPTSYQFA
jgi:1-acyl-sn-glycerol-3-phosphate acyltransferase